MKNLFLIFLMCSYTLEGSPTKRKASSEPLWTSHVALEVLSHFVIPSLAEVKVEDRWCRQTLENGDCIWKPLWIGTSEDLKSIHALRQSCRAIKERVDFYGRSEHCSPASLVLQSSDFDAVARSFLSSKKSSPSGVVDCEMSQQSNIFHSDYVGFLRFEGLYNDVSFEQTLLSLHPFHVLNFLDKYKNDLRRMSEDDFRGLLERVFMAMENRLHEGPGGFASYATKPFFQAVMWSTAHSLLKNFYAHSPVGNHAQGLCLFADENLVSCSAKSYLGLTPYGQPGLVKFHSLLKKFWSLFAQVPTGRLNQLSIHQHVAVDPSIEVDPRAVEQYLIQPHEIEVLLRFAAQRQAGMFPIYLYQTWLGIYRMSGEDTLMNSSLFEEETRLPILAVLLQVWKIVRDHPEMQVELKQHMQVEG
ncbi:MAG: hypothetical protein AB8C84_00835 [Oligoflexales bacterium]